MKKIITTICILVAATVHIYSKTPSNNSYNDNISENKQTSVEKSSGEKNEFVQMNEVVKLLTDMGYENVRFLETNDEIIYTVENNYEKRMGIGLARALSVISKNGLSGKNYRVIVTENNIPKISMINNSTVSQSFDKEIEDEDVDLSAWKVTYDIGNNWKKIRRTKKYNSSLFKVDINIYPQISLKNLIITQVYQSLFQLSPSVDVSLWPGSKLSFMAKIPIYNDGYSQFENKIHPGHITLSQRFRLPYNIRGRATIGAFNKLSWGGDVELFYPFKFNERFSLTGRVGYTGIHVWNGFKWHYDNDMTTTWSIGGNYYWAEQNMQLSLSASKYLFGDKGIMAEAIRNFRYASVGFYAVKGFENKAHLNAGFKIQVLLPLYKNRRFKKCRYIPRVNFSPNMGIRYNANNEFNYYREYKTEASDNIMSRNQYNPFFIKSELRKY